MTTLHFHRVKISFSCFLRKQAHRPACNSSHIKSRKMSTFLNSTVKGILLDITGVLYECGQNNAIKGSIDAIHRIRALGLPFRLVTNETQSTRSSLVSKLNSFGFSFTETELISPGQATALYIKKMKLHPFLLVHPNNVPDFSGCDTTSPDCVVIGDASEHFSYENMNKAFKILMTSEKPLLISMGKGKYYKEKDELVLDLGGYTAALEYATGVEAKIIGKPSPDYFMSALDEMGITSEEAVMVGDDVNSDVHAAQKCGMKGVLVKTGKFREVDLLNPDIKPDAVVDNLSHFVDMLCQKK